MQPYLFHRQYVCSGRMQWCTFMFLTLKDFQGRANNQISPVHFHYTFLRILKLIIACWISLSHLAGVDAYWLWKHGIIVNVTQSVYQEPFNYYGLTYIPAWFSHRTASKVSNISIHLFPNFNGCTFDVWERIGNFILYLTGYVIAHPCWD